jgi:hypothetical protein
MNIETKITFSAVSYSLIDADLMGNLNGVDICNQYTNCSTCSNDSLCGWCLIEGTWTNKSSCWTRSDESRHSCEVPFTGGFFLDSQCHKVPTPAPTSDAAIESSSSASQTSTIVAAVLVPLVVILLCTTLVVLFVFWRRRFSKKDNTIDTTPMTAVVAMDPGNVVVGDYQNTKASVARPNHLLPKERKDNKLILPADIDFSGWLIPSSELKMEQEIGRGAFGVVFKGQWRGTPVAVKQILSTEMNEKELKAFVAEITLMRALRPHGK